jgi:hypothetical protein
MCTECSQIARPRPDPFRVFGWPGCTNGSKDRRLLFRGNPDAGVLNLNSEAVLPGVVHPDGLHAQSDGAGMCVLDHTPAHVDKNLVQFRPVHADQANQSTESYRRQLKILLLARNAHHVDHIHARDLKSIPACFSPDDFQDVINQSEQMRSASADNVQSFGLFGGDALLSAQQIGEAGNGNQKGCAVHDSRSPGKVSWWPVRSNLIPRPPGCCISPRSFRCSPGNRRCLLQTLVYRKRRRALKRGKPTFWHRVSPGHKSGADGFQLALLPFKMLLRTVKAEANST